jgi:S1-C subfamily serine protease
MTFGIVSGLGRSLPASGATASRTQGASYTIPDIIQTDAPVNPGNSGGVLLDLSGNLVGVPSAIASSMGTSAGVGFAIPSAIVKQVVPELIQNGKFVHPWIGISGTTLTPEMAQAMSLSQTQRGALVIDVTQGSPAEKAGLRGSTQQTQLSGANAQVGGDVITAIDGQPVNRFEDLVTYLARSAKVDQTVKLTVLRDGKETVVSLTLAARPAAAQAASRSNQQSPNTQPAPRSNQQPPSTPAPDQGAKAGTAWLGVAGIDLTSDIAKTMNLAENQTGALLQQVVSGSPADKAGLRAGSEDYQTGGQSIKIGGDVVVAANDKKIESMQGLAGVVQGMKPGDKLDLTVLRDGKETKVTAELTVRPPN